MANLAFVSTMAAYPWGGSEELWSATALALARRGHRVSASVQRWSPTGAPLVRLRNGGVRVTERSAGYARRVLSEFGRVSGVDVDTRLREGWLRREAPALVCISSGDMATGAPWMAACRRLGVPYVSLGHSNSERWWPDDASAGELRELLQAAACCFFVAEGNLRLLEVQLAARLENAEIVRNPCRVRAGAVLPWPDAPSGGPLRLACVGRLYPPAKGQDLAIRALALPEWRGRDVTLSFFGTGPHAGALERLAAIVGVGDRVEFRGYVSGIEDIWSDHHALFLPSRSEGLPLVLVEAMACGRPAIVTAVAGNPEVVLDGETGFLAAAPTVPLVADALERAWARRSEWQQIGERAARHIGELMPEDAAGAFADRLERALGAA